jgi:RNA polymerase sigma factor (TIGR02999 family)
MTARPPTELSLLLQQANQGDEHAREHLFVVLQNEMRSLAAALMSRERPDHTLQATALVNEACLRLLGSDAIKQAADRRYVFAMANRAMRQVLIDHARSRKAEKRGGEHQKVSLDFVLENFESHNQCQFEDLDIALSRLESESPRQREVVELKFFSGLTLPEVAEVLEVSLGTVQRDWKLARAKLFHYLSNP